MSAILSDYNSSDRINSNVARKRVYSDLDLAFIINPITKDISPLTDIDAVKNSIKNLLLTNTFDRPFNPSIGSGLVRLLFEPASVFTEIELQDTITKVINKYETRVNNVRVDVTDRSESNGYDVSVTFNVFYSDVENEIGFFLTRLR